MINGFVYGDIAGGPSDGPSRLRWLALQPPEYHPQPFRQLAKVLSEMGRDDGATRVRIAKEIAQRRFGHESLAQRAWSLMLQYTIGFGYQPLRALWWIAGFVGLGTILFGWGYRMRIITPTEEAAYREFVASGDAPPHYPVFNPLVYSLENFLPVVELHQDKYWRPNPRHRVPGQSEARRRVARSKLSPEPPAAMVPVAAHPGRLDNHAAAIRGPVGPGPPGLNWARKGRLIPYVVVR